MATNNDVNYNLGGMTNTGIVKYNGTTLITSTTALIDSSNRTTNSSQPCFSAFVNANVNDVTGDATLYTLIFNSTNFDQNSNFNTGTGTFTAPVTGKYLFCWGVGLFGLLVTHTLGQVTLVTTGRTVSTNFQNPFTCAASGEIFFGGSAIVSMTANDVANVKVQVNGGTKVVDLVGGNSDVSFLHGHLIC